MEKGNNYPIKYAVMPIYRPPGAWRSGVFHYERNYNEIVCNIVSKCYVIREIKTYNGDGTDVQTFEVVFPFRNYMLNNDHWDYNEIPNYNFSRECNNGIIVENIFDNYEEAKRKADEINNHIMYNEIGILPLNDIEHLQEAVDKIKKEYAEEVALHEEMEAKIEEALVDLIVMPIDKQDKQKELKFNNIK